MPGTSSEPGTVANRCKYPSPHMRPLLGPPRTGRGPHVLHTRLSAWESAGRWSHGGGERLENHMRVHAVVFAACQHALLRSARPCCCGVPVITLTRLPATAVPAVSSPPAGSEIPAVCTRAANYPATWGLPCRSWQGWRLLLQSPCFASQSLGTSWKCLFTAA